MSRLTPRLALAAAIATGTLLASLPGANAAPADKGYGCFRAKTSMNIRQRPWASSDVIATAKEGETFVKRKRFCNIRGYWCAITTSAGVDGYGDTSLMEKTECK